MSPKQLVQDVKSLYTLPDVVLRLNLLLQREDTTARELGELIACDPSLTARLLKFINSAYFGLPGKVESLSRALTLLGKEHLRTLVLEATVTNAFDGIPPDLVDMEAFWYNGISSGLLARALGQTAGIGETESLFIAGLLHGIGKLVMYARYPDRCSRILSSGDVAPGAVAAREREAFGFDYAEVSGELLTAWNLPERIREPVACHLEPARASRYRTESEILHIALRLVGQFEPGIKPSSGRNPGPVMLDPALLDAAGLAALNAPGALNELKIRVAGETMEIAEIFFRPPPKTQGCGYSPQ